MYIIDVNYFPGVSKVHNHKEHLAAALAKVGHEAAEAREAELAPMRVNYMESAWKLCSSWLELLGGWIRCAADVLLSPMQPSVSRRCSASQLFDDDAALSFQLPV